MAAAAEKIVETTKITLPQMVDISINSGEAGLINFNLLHALLHVIIQQCHLSTTQVEFRGSDGARLKKFIQSMSTVAPQLTLTEYFVAEDSKVQKATTTPAKAAAPAAAKAAAPDAIPSEAKKDDAQKIMVKDQVVEMSDKLKREISKQEVRKEKLVKVIKRRKSSKEEINPDPEPLKEASPSLYSLDKLIVVEQTGKELPQFSVALTKSQFENMEKDISDLRSQVKELIEMPKNSGIISAIKKTGDDGASPLLDLFQIMTLAKRLDAAEINMEKLASMFADLARGMTGAEGTFEDIEKAGVDPNKVASFKNIKQLEERVDELERIVAQGGSAKPGKKKKQDSQISFEEGTKSLEETEPGDVATGGGGGSGSVNQLDGKTSVLDGVDLSQLPMKKALKLIQQELQNIRTLIDIYNLPGLLKDVEDLKDKMGGESEAANLPPDARLKKIENKYAECLEQLNSLDTMYNHQMKILQTQLQDVEKELAAALEKLVPGFIGGGDTGQTEHSVLELYDKLIRLQEEVNIIAESMEGLLQEKSNRDLDLTAMIEQIELLKTIKADREDLEDALADKADACAVNRKVSYSQFNATFDDLSRGIDEAISKLSQQEILWKTALTDIQIEMERKMNKQELAPLKDFINERLKNLQEKFKTLTALKKEHEAAGTKSKFLRNVNCISCDKDVVMRKEMDSSLMPQAPVLPPTRSMGPYLAYELDQLRKQQKCLPKGKNLNYLEDALGAKQPKDKDHICNRYCGGSHTVTTPQQRVTRIGHFLQQYGPEVSPLNETMVKGADGHEAEPQPRSSSAGREISSIEAKAKEPRVSSSKEARMSTGKVPGLSPSKQEAVKASPSKEAVKGSSNKEAKAVPSKEAKVSASKDAKVSGSKEGRMGKEIGASSSQDAKISSSKETKVSGSKESKVSSSKDAKASGSKEVSVSSSKEAKVSASKDAKLSPSREGRASLTKEVAASLSGSAKNEIAPSGGDVTPSKNVSFSHMEPPVRDTDEVDAGDA